MKLRFEVCLKNKIAYYFYKMFNIGQRDSYLKTTSAKVLACTPDASQKASKKKGKSGCMSTALLNSFFLSPLKFICLFPCRFR